MAFVFNGTIGRAGSCAIGVAYEGEYHYVDTVAILTHFIKSQWTDCPLQLFRVLIIDLLRVRGRVCSWSVAPGHSHRSSTSSFFHSQCSATYRSQLI